MRVSPRDAPGFLARMARVSRARLGEARQREAEGVLCRRARAAPAAPLLRLHPAGFDVIGEVKLRSPAAGRVGAMEQGIATRAARYVAGGAAAVSVLTESTCFDGSLAHLTEVAEALQPLGVPVMRKDFLIDPYQVLEARAAGAGGILVILRMVDDRCALDMLDCAAESSMFVILEAFDEGDLERAAALARLRQTGGPQCLVGLNSRDLDSLRVDYGRLTRLAARLPQGIPAVAESGLAMPGDAAELASLGYAAALVGTALMRAAEPAHLVTAMLRSGRSARRAMAV